MRLERNMQSQTSELNHIQNSTFVRAGAGAGKTTKLISTFYEFSTQFKQRHRRWPRVILSTFTRKATQEIRERLIATALKKNDADFLDYLNRRNLVQISTIHGLLQNLINRNHDQIGFQSQFVIVDDAEEKKQLFRYLKAKLRSDESFSVLLEHFKVPELLGMIQKYIRLYRQYSEIDSVSPSELRQFTKDRAVRSASLLNEILNEFALLPNDVLSKWQAYLDVLTKYSKLLQSGKIEDSLILLETQIPTKPKFFLAKPAFDVGLHERLVSYLKDDANKFTYADTEEFFSEFEQCRIAFLKLARLICDEWTRDQQKSGRITMSDMELLSLQISSSHSDAMAQFATEIDFIMLDEFQDTSPLQLSILKPILKSVPTFIVGDPQQSIYLFRGARSQVFSQMFQQAKSEGRKIEWLETNYRSAPDLLNFFNSFFTNLSSDFSPMSAGRKQTDFKNPVLNGSRIGFCETADQILTCEYLIHQILKSGALASDICILSPRQKLLVDCVSHLRERGINAELQLAGGLSQKREVIDFFSFLKFLVIPFDNENLLKLIRTPWFFIPDKSIFETTKSMSSKSLWAGLLISQPEIAGRLSNYRRIFKTEGFVAAIFQFLKNEKVIEWALAIDSSGRFESNLFKTIHAVLQESQRSDFSLNEYLERNSQLTVDLEGSGQSESPPADHKDSIHCMTVHGSKGLQFKHVILVGMNHEPNQKNTEKMIFDEDQKKFIFKILDFETSSLCLHPWGEAVTDRRLVQESEEYLRLLYVAATRAEESIYFLSESLEKVKSGSWRGRVNWPVYNLEEKADSTLDLQVAQHLGHAVLVGRHLLADLMSAEQVQIQKASDSQNKEFSKESDVLDHIPKRFKTASVTSLVEDEAKSNGKQNSIGTSLVDAQLKALSGTRAHAIFESLKYWLPESDSLTVPNLPPQLKNQFTPTEIKAVEFLRTLNEIPLMQILKNGFVEFGFKLKATQSKNSPEPILIQGQIDAWGAIDTDYGRKVYIIDYKTGDQKYKEKAFLQLGAYADCLRKMNFILPSDQVILATVFPIDEKVFCQDWLVPTQ